MKKETAEDLAFRVWDENQPVDWSWVNHRANQLSKKQLLEWAKGMIEPFADKDTSKHKTTRASRILLKYLNL